jgi:uncharacterized phage protein (TIGR01671 family)
MTEVKFRGKRLTDGEWIYGSLIITKFKDNPANRYYIVNFLGNYTFDHEVVPATIGQWLGSRDKEGRDIYEGDVVRGELETWDDHMEETRTVKFESKVLYRHNAFSIYRAYFGSSMGLAWQPFTPEQCISSEIIGNIHDNPDLKSNAGSTPDR